MTGNPDKTLGPRRWLTVWANPVNVTLEVVAEPRRSRRCCRHVDVLTQRLVAAEADVHATVARRERGRRPARLGVNVEVTQTPLSICYVEKRQ
jgi:hypothetical protein